MATPPPEVAQILSYASNIFALNPELLVFPTLIGSVIIPMILNSYAIKLVADRIRMPSMLGWLVGLVTAYLTLPWGSIMVFGSLVIIAFLSRWRLSLRIIFLIAMVLFLIWGLPILYNYLTGSLIFRL